MDSEQELAKAKWLLICGAIFLLSCFMCYDELAYLLWGREAQATVAKVYESRSRRGPTRLTVEFTFSEPGGLHRKGMVTVPTDWSAPRSGTVPVEYTAGELGRARLAGQVNWTWIIVFAASVAAMGVFGYRLWREANDDAPRKRRV